MLQSELTMAKLKRFDSCIGRPTFSLWNGTSSNIWLSPILMDETSPYVVNQFADFTVDHTLQAGFAETEITQITQRETTCLFPRVSRTEQKSCGFILKSLHIHNCLIWQLSVPKNCFWRSVRKLVRKNVNRWRAVGDSIGEFPVKRFVQSNRNQEQSCCALRELSIEVNSEGKLPVFFEIFKWS